jgi:4-hydroxy-tetrahydrodipicolinate synthase
MDEAGINASGFAALIRRLSGAGVDSICVLGSTGNYAYLTRAERSRVVRLAVEHAGGVPVFAGIGALRTRDAVLLAQDAQEAGASAVLLAPVSYHKLAAEEVFALYEAVDRSLAIPLCVYDNPEITRFDFSDVLHGRIARLPNVRSIKIPGVPTAPGAAHARVASLRAQLTPPIAIGVSGDSCAAEGLVAGCELWYSVIGGVFPETALAITRAAQSGDAAEALRLSARLAPLWALYDKYGGSLRVMAAALELLGIAPQPSLPLPLAPIQREDQGLLARLIADLGLQ